MGLLAGAQLQAQAPSTDFFSDPDNVARFKGSYASRLVVEPRVNPEDKEFMEEFAAKILSDRADAMEMMRKKAAEKDSNATFDLIMGNLQYEEGDLRAALTSYKNAIKDYDEFLRAHENIGFLYYQLGEVDKAREHFTTAIKLGAVNKNIYALLGYLFFENEQYIAAETAYRSALIYEVQNADWEFGLAKSILFQRKYKDAIGVFEALIEKNPEEPEYWELQADAYMGLDQNLLAASNFEVLRRMQKISAEDLILLGDIYVENEFIQSALVVYKEAIVKRGKLNVEKPLAAASTLINAGFYEEAKRVLSEINRVYGKSLDSKVAFIMRKLEAKIDASTGAADGKVINILEDMIEQNPLDGDVLIMLADYYSTSGRFEKAEFLYKRAQNISEYEAKSLFHYGKALVAKGDYRKAVRTLERAQDSDPKDNVAEYLAAVTNVYHAVR